MSSRPVVAVIGTGGTISTRSSSGSLDLVDYMVGGTTLCVEDVLDAVPEARGIADIHPIHFRAISSTAITFEDWHSLVLTVDRVCQEQPSLAGIVILHGTSTMEETAYMMQLTVKSSLPVVLTGSQRPLSALSSDAEANIVNAVRVAASPGAVGMGVLVCLNDEIHAAREVSKSSTSRLDTFRTPDFGIVGQIDGYGVSFYRRPLRQGPPDTEFEIRTLSALPRVDIAYCYAGDDGTVVDALVVAGAQGIVMASLPAGRLSVAQMEACERALDAGIAVVMSTRAGSGRAILPNNLRKLGIVGADNLNPQKARLLLSLALTITKEPKELERIFATY